MAAQLRLVERVCQVCAKSGFDGEENRMGQDCCLEKGPEMGQRVLKDPCYILEKRTCVLSSRGPGGSPPSWPGVEETARAPGTPDLQPVTGNICSGMQSSASEQALAGRCKDK